MRISEPFIRRPMATSLFTIAIVLVGAVAFNFLPIAPLPQVDFLIIAVESSLCGASAETVATSVATPLERALPLTEVDRYANDYLAQQISQIPGVGLVDFHGEQKPASGYVSIRMPWPASA